MTLLYFFGACAAIALVGFLVSRFTGARAFYVEDWQFNPGETVLWRDDASDTYLIPKLGQAEVMSFARLRRGVVVVTNQRILIGTKPLFGSKRMVQQVLYAGTSPDANSAQLDGGLLTRGYQTLVIQPGVLTPHLEGNKPWVDLKPLGTEGSSANLETIRIFTDQASTFRLP